MSDTSRTVHDGSGDQDDCNCLACSEYAADEAARRASAGPANEGDQAVALQSEPAIEGPTDNRASAGSTDG